MIDPPLQEEPQAGLYGAGVGFYDDETLFWDGPGFVRGHEWQLGHLQTLAEGVPSSGYETFHHGADARSI